MKTSVVMTTLCLGAFASSAIAAELSIKGNIDQTVDASNNYFLNNSPSGWMGRSLTAGTLDFLAQTSSTSYLLNTNYSYYKYFGPGTADTSLTWGTPASATFTVNHVTELTRYNLSTSWTRSDAATTQLAQSGVATAHGSINTYAVNGGLTHDLGRIDSISWSAGASTVSFTDPTSTPYVDVTSALAWTHNLTQTTTWTNSVNFDWFSEDDPAKSQRLFWTVTSGLQSQLSPRLSVNGNAGFNFVNSWQAGEASTIIPSGGFQPMVGAGHGWTATVGLNYKLLKTTQVSLTAAHVVIPLFSGQLQLSDTIGLTLTHNINEFSTLAFATNFAQTTSGTQLGQTLSGGAAEFFSASVNYDYKLTREWRTGVSYTYNQRNDETGIARSSSVLFHIARDFTVLGNPGAINKAAEERARKRAQQSIGQVFPAFQ